MHYLAVESMQVALLRKIEFYFSKESLSNDLFLVSQINPDLFVPIPVIAGYAEIPEMIGDDLEMLLQTMLLSDKLVVDEKQMRVRPAFRLERRILVLRNLSSKEL